MTEQELRVRIDGLLDEVKEEIATAGPVNVARLRTLASVASWLADVMEFGSRPPHEPQSGWS